MCRSGSRQSVHHVVLTRHAQAHAANALALIHNGKVFADRIFFVEPVVVIASVLPNVTISAFVMPSTARMALALSALTMMRFEVWAELMERLHNIIERAEIVEMIGIDIL